MERVKVFALMAGLTALLVVIGGAIGGRGGATIFFVLAALMNFGMYWFSDKVVLKMYKAKIIGAEDAPELYQMVDRLRQRAGLPMPTVAIAPSQQPNAFATGRNAQHAVVCCTAGILQLVNREELEGVVAHELAHIKHRHMLVGTVAATMAGAIGMVGSRSASIGRPRSRPESVLIVLDLRRWHRSPARTETAVAPSATAVVRFARRTFRLNCTEPSVAHPASRGCGILQGPPIADCSTRSGPNDHAGWWLCYAV